MKVRKDEFELGYLVLKWDAPRQDRGKHNKFDALYIGPFKILEIFLNNMYMLQDLEGEEVFNDPINGYFRKKCFFLALDCSSVFVNIVFLLIFGLINDSIAQQQGTRTIKSS
jgi:hypothetical protein